MDEKVEIDFVRLLTCEYPVGSSMLAYVDIQNGHWGYKTSAKRMSCP